MTSEEELRAAASRADAASRIFGEPLLKEAFSVIEREIVDALKSCPARDAEGRDLLVRMLQLQEKYRAVFLGWIETGKMARIELDRTILQRTRAAIRKVI